MSERYGHKLVGGARARSCRPPASRSFATLDARTAGSGRSSLATLVIGTGAALAMTPATNAIVASLPRAKQGVASAVNDTARELGAAFGVAILGSAFNIGYRHSIDGHLVRPPADPSPRQAREAPAIAIQIAHNAARRRRVRPRGARRVHQRHALRRRRRHRAPARSVRCSCSSAARRAHEEVLEDDLDVLVDDEVSAVA